MSSLRIPPPVGRWQQIWINTRRVYIAKRRGKPATTTGRAGGPEVGGRWAPRPTGVDSRHRRDVEMARSWTLLQQTDRQIDWQPSPRSLHSTYLLSAPAAASGFASRDPPLHGSDIWQRLTSACGIYTEPLHVNSTDSRLRYKVRLIDLGEGVV